MSLEDFSVCLSHSTVPGKLCFLKALCTAQLLPGILHRFPGQVLLPAGLEQESCSAKRDLQTPKAHTHTAIPAHFVLLYIST